MQNNDLTVINAVIDGNSELKNISAEIMAELLMDDNHSTYKMFERIAAKYVNNPELRDGIDFTLTELVGYNTAELAKKIMDYNLEHTSDEVKRNEQIYTIEYTSDEIEGEKYLPFFVTAKNPEEAKEKAESIITKHFWRFDITNVSLGMKHKIGEDDYDKNFTDLKVLSEILFEDTSFNDNLDLDELE